MTAPTPFPPVVEAYLEDLERALAASDPRERAETLAAVREHAAESLAVHGDDAAGARRVLDELGPVEAIAAEATPAATPPPAADVTADTTTRTPAADVWLLVLTVASFVLLVVPPVALAAVTWAAVRLRSGGGNRAMQRLSLTLGVVALVGSVAVYVAHELSAG